MRVRANMNLAWLRRGEVTEVADTAEVRQLIEDGRLTVVYEEGGPVSAGQTYQVGDQGEEFVIPPAPTLDDLDKKQLRAVAAARGITVPSSWTKADIREAIDADQDQR